jgi:magnesium chelatase family protein
MLEQIAALDEPGRQLLTRAAEAGGVTARGWTRTLRLARTIADLDGSETVRRLHIAEALIYRRSPGDPGQALAQPTQASTRLTNR